LVFTRSAYRCIVGALAIGALLILLPPGLPAVEFQVKTVSVGSFPQEMALSNARNLVFVADRDSVSVIDGRRNEVVSTIPTGAIVLQLHYVDEYDQLFVALHDGTMEVFAPAGNEWELTDILSLYDGPQDAPPPYPLDMAYSPLYGKLFTSMRVPFLSILSLDSGELSSVPIPDIYVSYSVLLDEMSDRFYLLGYSTDNMAVGTLSGNAVLRYIPLSPGSGPWLGEMDPGREKIFISNVKDHTVTFFDSRAERVDETVVTGPTSPRSLKWNPRTGQLYVSLRDEDAVLAIDGGTYLTSRIAVGRAPDRIGLEADRDTVFVANVGDATVSIIDGSGAEVVQTVPVGERPRAVLVNESTRKVYVTNQYSSSVSILFRPVDPDRSIVTAEPSDIPADGQSTSLVTVIPKDADGNDIGAGRSVVISSTAGTLLGSVSDNGDGTYTQLLQSGVLAVTATISAAVDSIPLSSHPCVFMTLHGHPCIRSANPTWGYIIGGTRVILEGEHFGTDALVWFGSAQADVLSCTDQKIECVTAAHPAGMVDIVVDNRYARGEFPDGFTYVDEAELRLMSTVDLPSGDPLLVWESPNALRDFTVTRSTSADFSTDVVQTEVSGNSYSDPEDPPVPPGVFFYRVRYR
jgi:YVTN family beta-propeller protein